MAGIYEPERISKIAKIIPEFARVATRGDAVYFGLDGDPMRPEKYRGEREEWLLEDKTGNEADGYVLTFRNGGDTKTVRSSTIHPEEVFEFTDAAFRGVMEREAEKQDKFRGEYAAKSGGTDVEDLERRYEKFRGVVMAAIEEITRDIRNLADKTSYRGALGFSARFQGLREAEEAEKKEEEEAEKEEAEEEEEYRSTAPSSMFSDLDSESEGGDEYGTLY